MFLLQGDNKQWGCDVVYYYYYECFGVYMVKCYYGIVIEDYKLVYFYYDIDEWELYDCKKDFRELNNVYDDLVYVKVVEEFM